MSSDWFPGAGNDEDRRRYGQNSRIMLSAVVCLFFVVTVVLVLHIYARCALRRRLRSRAAHQMSLTVTQTDSRLEPPKTGLDPSIIEKLPVFIYKRTDGRDESGADCAVCLGAIEENEMARLLPSCKHLFHVQCIDLWLRSHSTCPICRTEAEPQVKDETAESTAASPSAPPVDLSTAAEGSSDAGQSSKVGISGLRNSFRKMISLTGERSERRAQTCAPGETVEDLETQ